MKIVCPACGKEIDETKHGKYAPHKNGKLRCAMSGKRVESKKGG